MSGKATPDHAVEIKIRRTGETGEFLVPLLDPIQTGP